MDDVPWKLPQLFYFKSLIVLRKGPHDHSPEVHQTNFFC
jgi:hypothetical protein